MPEDGKSEPDERRAQGPVSASVSVFVRCGERYLPPAPEHSWSVVTLPAELKAEHLPEAVAAVRAALRGHRHARVLISGPLTLAVALGQGLAHDPVAIDYVQLDQTKKEFEVWVTNRRNL